MTTMQLRSEPMTDELLADVLDAHGGLENWNAVTEITAELSLGGPFWGARGWPDVYADQTVTLDPHREHITFAPFTAPDRISVLDVDPERVAIRTRDGEIVEERTAPRATFPLPFDDYTTPWDAIQVAYFTSAAVWNYLTAPFVFVAPGVQAREIEPWQEDGETWRRLAVTFPETIANHNAEQVFYYDDAAPAAADGLLAGRHRQPAGRPLHARPQDVRRLRLPDPPAGAPARRRGPRGPELRADHGRRPHRHRHEGGFVMTDIHGAVAVVTGANRGLGRHFAEQLLERGAAKVYATARDPQQLDLAGVVPLQLDITDPASVARAAELAADATLLINNAGILTHTRLTDGDLDQIRLEMDTNNFGTLAVTRAFAPVLAANGGGSILNVLSILSWLHIPDEGAYSVAKAAAWAQTNVVRQELAPLGIQVAALHVGYMDTRMSDDIDPSMKSDPAVIAGIALDGVAAGDTEILGDEITRSVKQQLSATPVAA